MKQNNTKKLVYSALFLALALVLPFLTGQIQTFGQMLAPMHLPVLLCGFVCGPVWGLAVGAVAPRGVGLRDVPFDGRVRRRLRHGGLCGGRVQLGLAGHSGAAGGRAAHCICAGARRPCRAHLRPKPF